MGLFSKPKPDTTVITYRQKNGSHAKTAVNSRELAAVKEAGALVKVHEQK